MSLFIHNLHLAYIIYKNIQSHKEKRTHISLDKNSNRILYRRYTEQFKLHFTDKNKSKIEYQEVG